MKTAMLFVLVAVSVWATIAGAVDFLVYHGGDIEPINLQHKVWLKRHVLRLPVLEVDWPGPIIPLAELAPEHVDYQWMPVQIPGLEIADGYPFNLGGAFYKHGLGMHAETQETFEVPPGAVRLVGMAGRVDRGHACRRNALVMAVLVDGTVAWQQRVVARESSPTFLQPTPTRFDVSVAGADTVTLAVTDGDDGIECDHVAWGDPEFLVLP